MTVPTTYGIPDGLIAPADIAKGMDIAAVTTTDRGIVQARGTVTLVTSYAIMLGNDQAGSTVDPDTSFYLMAAPPTPATPEPDLGSILLDETGAAWQRMADGWHSINGELTDWATFLATHPSYTVLQDEPVTPLPAPVSPYPQTITPDSVRLGMDTQVTITYTDGGTRIVRGICVWNQDNGPDKTDTFDDWLRISLSNGEQFHYSPLPDTVTAMTVEQMQDWTADTVWDITNLPEPGVGSVVRSYTGIAWQRTADATEDGPLIDGTGPWYLAGQGMWSSVTGDYPRSFLWLWGAAAPFNVQEATP